MAVAGRAKGKLGSVFQTTLLTAKDAALTSMLVPPPALRPVDGVITIKAVTNNTHAAFNDLAGRVVAKGSGGFEEKGNGKARRLAGPARGAVLPCCNTAFEKGHRVVRVRFSGSTAIRRHVLGAVTMAQLRVAELEDITPFGMPGTRPRKTRR
jgi:ribosomal protein S11